jgi:hypothetical protein
MTTADELLGRLTGLGRDELAKVLAHRPDVLQEPWPRRLDVVAARLAAPESVDEALLGLPLPHAQVLRALQLCYATRRRHRPAARRRTRRDRVLCGRIGRPCAGVARG